MTHARIVFAVFLLTVTGVAVVHLRTTSSRVFYQYRSAYVDYGRSRRQLRHKQLELETLTNPAVVSQRVLMQMIAKEDSQSVQRQ